MPEINPHNVISSTMRISIFFKFIRSTSNFIRKTSSSVDTTDQLLNRKLLWPHSVPQCNATATENTRFLASVKGSMRMTNLRFQSLIGLTPERNIDYFFCM